MPLLRIALLRVKVSKKPLNLNQEIENCDSSPQQHYQQIVLEHSGLEEAEQAPAALGKNANPVDTAIYDAAVVLGEKACKAPVDKPVETFSVEDVQEPSTVEQFPYCGNMAEEAVAAGPLSSVFKPRHNDSEKTGGNPHNEEPVDPASVFGDMLDRVGMNRMPK